MRDSPTARQLEFVEHYPSGLRGVRFNATAAARAAGYAWPDRQGPRLQTMPLVARMLSFVTPPPVRTGRGVLVAACRGHHRVTEELSRGDLAAAVDPAPGPLERLLAAEAGWLAIPPRRRPRGFSTALMGLGLPWDGAVVGSTPRLAAPCPACHDHPIGRCLVCSASDEDPARWPMMAAKERARILAGPPPRGRVAKAKARREKRASARAAGSRRPA